MSMKKIVTETGMATDTRFLSIPLTAHFLKPSVSLRWSRVCRRLRLSCLNISLRSTSAGLVRIAPPVKEG